MQTELNKFFRLGSPRTGADKQMIQLDPHTSKSTSIRIAFIEPGYMRRSGRVVGNPYLGIVSGLPVIQAQSRKVTSLNPSTVSRLCTDKSHKALWLARNKQLHPGPNGDRSARREGSICQSSGILKRFLWTVI